MKIPLIFILMCTISITFGLGSHGKVPLKDIQVLTLRRGEMTTGQRSSPIPQLNCVGGPAYGEPKPHVVQCYNRGWDGQDVQWECKAEMESNVRFGSVEVVCEGYDYPDDPYILKGSCGLEYTLEYTGKGKQNTYNSYSNNYAGGSYGSTKYGKWTGLSDLATLGGIAFFVYIVYKMCISSGDNVEDRQYSSTSGDYPAGGGGGAGGWANPGNNGGTGNGGDGWYRDDASCGRRRQPGTGGGGGFWSGLAAGGLLGYMFGGTGQRSRGYYGYNQRPNYGGGGGGFWGGSSGGWGSGGRQSSGGGGESSRTTSGFGGTRRR